ncbi:MAG: DegT/DnrJ/EryC1/StrS aminotransferase family protein [candidate division SR1 bacterium]|nr:DegT/DnrJ/EryC1/StrS aminotransferase family protein [candidate division SR1 bacterium]
MKRKLVACEIGPNYQLEDGVIALKLLVLLPIYHIFKKQIHQDKIIKNIFSDSSYIQFVDSGRTAMTLLLRSLSLDKESEVIIQGFSCVVVPNSVLQSNLVPILCDINETDYNLDLVDAEKKITNKTRVLIVQYSFGIIPKMNKVVEFCKKYNLILIEDCAHIFSHPILINGKEKQVGSLGYGSVLSFGRDKVVSSTIGGAVILNDSSKLYKTRLHEEYQNLPKISILREYQSLIYCILCVFLIRPFYHYGLGKLALFIFRKLHFIGGIYSIKEKKVTSEIVNHSKYSATLSILLQNQLKKISIYKAHRDNISKIYANELDLPVTNYNYLRFPVCVPSSAYSNIKSILRQNHILVGTWYNSIFIPADADLSKLSYNLGDLPICEKLVSNRVLNLPTNIHVTEKDAKKIASIIKPFLISK